MPTEGAQFHIKENILQIHQDNRSYGIAHYNLKPLKQQWFKHLESVLSAIIQQYSCVLHQLKTNKQNVSNILHQQFFLTWGSSKSSFNRWKGIHVSRLSIKAVWLASVLPRRQCCPIYSLIGGLGWRGRKAVLLLVTFQEGRFSLRTRWGLLCFDWAVCNHVVDALAEMALLGLGW